ncbi:MAG TPA: fluoride efflux transporter CrcB [Anaerolineae bacterium]|nr:fluoride efflux transporter CrcB [Anaerolineae bacterium]
MGRIVLVGLGGAVGSILRYLVSGYVQDASGSIGFPFGTLAVNVIGCLVIGILTQLAEARGILTPEARALLVVGVMGGFTTFSTFGNETVALLRDGENILALVNIGASLVLGFGAVYIGRALVSVIWR